MINFKKFTNEQELVDFVNKEKVKVVGITSRFTLFYGAKKAKKEE